jgi:lipopolysaccharide/colanic/teichoic acid biosynthesis glycosyltransferase
MKELTERLIALCLYLLTSPLWYIVILAVFIQDGKEPYFVQRRLGKEGKEFKMLKFRTMRAGNHRITDYKQDDRVTPVGVVLRRFHIDEIPQLLNIIAGDMSFVGPRPVPEYVDGEQVILMPGYAERSRVKPGVTGLAQVYCTKYTNLRNKFKYDTLYVRKACLGLDIHLLLATLRGKA